MRLEFKDTIYDPIFELTNDTDGLKDNDFWININFALKNEDIDFKGIVPGMSFSELKYWNKQNKRFLDGLMKHKETVKFIKRIGELIYYPSEKKVEKRLYLFEDVDKYYSIYFTKEELEEIYNINKEFIDKHS